MYKIEIEVVQDGAHGNFVFWDREVSQLLQKSTAQLWAIMHEVTNNYNYFALSSFLFILNMEWFILCQQSTRVSSSTGLNVGFEVCIQS